MVTAGIDVGAQNVKAVILDGKKVLGWAAASVALDWENSSDEALRLALAKAGIERTDIKRIVSTGIGRKDVAHTDDTITDIIADARGAAFFFPTARTVIDIGAEEARGIRLNDSGKVLNFVKNDRCAAGAGAFVESMARALEVSVEEMGPLALKSRQEIVMNVTCAVFAESEVISLIHSRMPKEDIARAIHDAIVTRTVSMVKRIGIEKDVVFIGGVANNPGVVERMKYHLGMDVLIPQPPEIAGAVGAAVAAQEYFARDKVA